jgi:hypothetical protein
LFGNSATVNKVRKYVRIFGALRQKPGFPLQFLDPPYGGSAGFPLQSLAQPSGKQRICIRKFATSPLRAKG